MAHSVSRHRREQIARALRFEELRPMLAPGWTIDPGRGEIVEIKTVLGALQRRQVIVLRCQQRDCRRRCELDLRAAVQAGFADQPIETLIQHLRCQHWSGCVLKLHGATYPAGAPLVAFVHLTDTFIAIACETCGYRHVAPARDVILRLIEVGRGDGGTGLFEVGQRVRGPCRGCGGRRFAASVVWPRPSGGA